MHVTSSRIVWQGHSWRLRVDRLALADGRSYERGTIEHPGAVVLVPLLKIDGQPHILMLQQYRLALDSIILELPAGTRERGEAWQRCAQRELREETGYRAGSFVALGRLWPAPGNTDELMAIFLATGLTEDPLPQDVDEQIEVVSMPLATLVEMALDGRLQDAKSCVALLRTCHYLQKSP